MVGRGEQRAPVYRAVQRRWSRQKEVEAPIAKEVSKECPYPQEGEAVRQPEGWLLMSADEPHKDSGAGEEDGSLPANESRKDEGAHPGEEGFAKRSLTQLSELDEGARKSHGKKGEHIWKK